MFNGLLVVFLSILLPPDGLTPLSVVAWFSICLPLLSMVVAYLWPRQIKPKQAIATAPEPLEAPPKLHQDEPAQVAHSQAAHSLEDLHQDKPAQVAQAQPVEQIAQAKPKRRRLTPEEREQREQERIERLAERERTRQERQAKREEQARARAQRQAEQERKKQEREAKKAEREAKKAAKAHIIEAFGSDPRRRYQFRLRVVELDELIASNLDSGSINPAYDASLQPRNRNRAASVRQIEQMARDFVPETALWDFKQLDKGAPIVGDDLMVESGNGRTLALRKARAEFPEQFGRYQEALRDHLGSMGLAGELEGKQAPVLVRERISDVDRVEFAREANAPPVLQMSTLEVAQVDRQRISDSMLMQLAVKEDQSIDQALRARANAQFVSAFLGTLSENEAAGLLRKNGTLNQAGIWRVKAALFTRTFQGEAGSRIAETFLEALDSDTKNFEAAVSATLPQLARAESLISSGQRDVDLSMTDDISAAIDMLARLREAEIPVEMYREQSSLFERETTPFQEELLGHFDEIGRSPKKIREFLSGYANAIESAASPDQVDMFGDVQRLSKFDIFEQLTGRKISG